MFFFNWGLILLSILSCDFKLVYNFMMMMRVRDVTQQFALEPLSFYSKKLQKYRR